MKTMSVFLLTMACASLICTACQAQTRFTFMPVGHTNDGGIASAVVVSGHYAFLANSDDGLRIYDVSNPANPINIAHTNNGSAAMGLAVSSNYLYLANDHDGLRIYDISNPTNPINVGHSMNDNDRTPHSTAVALSGHYAYIADASRGVWVCDVSDPTNPVVVCQNAGTNAGLFYSSIDLALSGTNLFAACVLDGLRIYDASVPASPTNIGHAAGRARALAVDKDYVYVATKGRLQGYDVSAPSNPLEVGSAAYAPESSAFTVKVAGDYIFVGNNTDGLHVYDIREPSDPVEVGSVNVGFVRGVAVSGNYVYLANDTSGLQVYFLMPKLRIANTATNTIVLSWPVTAASFAVQQNGDLSTTDWITLIKWPTTNSGQNQVVLDSPDRPTFYRLMKQP